MKSFNGKVLFLDRADINTDEIIPAKYLTENTKDAMKPYLLEDLSLPGFDPGRDISGHSVIITRSNFGCGSSREHAPWALETNGINLVIATSFARIFRQNMYNCGMIAIELAPEIIDRLFAEYKGKDVSVETDLSRGIFTIKSPGKTEEISFTLTGFDRSLVESGGWVDFADKRY